MVGDVGYVTFTKAYLTKLRLCSYYIYLVRKTKLVLASAELGFPAVS
jgi:hypothetical protein